MAIKHKNEIKMYGSRTILYTKIIILLCIVYTPEVMIECFDLNRRQKLNKQGSYEEFAEILRKYQMLLINFELFSIHKNLY